MKKLLVYLTFILASCVGGNKKPPKMEPMFSPVIESKELKFIVDEYFKLSAYNNLKFEKNVTIGFSKIDRGAVIGTCAIRDNFREVELDKDHWEKATAPGKIILVYHELTHCYCFRMHDYDDGVEYPGSFVYIIQQIISPIYSPKNDGYLEDNCPKSIMHPTVMSDRCFMKHYKYYVKEMFNRCKPY